MPKDFCEDKQTDDKSMILDAPITIEEFVQFIKEYEKKKKLKQEQENNQ